MNASVRPWMMSDVVREPRAVGRPRRSPLTTREAPSRKAGGEMNTVTAEETPHRSEQPAARTTLTNDQRK